MGVGAKSGMVRMALTAQETYTRGFAIAEMDADNAFNRASRQAMMNAVQLNCPHLAKLFWMGYCSHVPLVFMQRGRDFAVLHSREGSRMGDQFAWLLCLLLGCATGLYRAIAQRCPTVSFQAATDDLKCYAEHPLDLCRMFPIAAEELKRHANITLNANKSAILLTPSHQDIAAAALPEGCFLVDGALLLHDGHRVELKRDGLVVAGAAVGTSQFVSAHFMGIVRRAIAKFEPIFDLDPQSALLLSGCLNFALGYHLQVTPPRLALAGAQAWDMAMDAARLRIAYSSSAGQAPFVGQALLELSHCKARSPTSITSRTTPVCTRLAHLTFIARLWIPWMLQSNARRPSMPATWLC